MKAKRITPLRAIRFKCLDCCCGSSYEVKMCTCENCSLYPFREGHNPFKAKREYTEEQRAAIGSRLTNSRISTEREKNGN